MSFILLFLRFNCCQGTACFERLVNDPHLKDIPLILETSGKLLIFPFDVLILFRTFR